MTECPAPTTNLQRRGCRAMTHQKRIQILHCPLPNLWDECFVFVFVFVFVCAAAVVPFLFVSAVDVNGKGLVNGVT